MRIAFILAMAIGTPLATANPEARNWKAGDGTEILYRWQEPAEVKPGERYPLVLFLHGAGERGEDNQAQLRHGTKDLLKHAKELGEACFFIAPQCPQGRWWSAPSAGRLGLQAAGEPNALLDGILELVDKVAAEHPVDPDRFYVTGISMGGFATWDLLVRAPGKIAAAIPVCGGGDPEKVELFKKIPIWTFHGDADNVVPVEATQRMVAALEEAGAAPKVTYYPGVAHNSWTRTYRDAAVVRWLFEQKRGTP